MKNNNEKNVTEKVRRFPKFYVLDVVIVLLVVAIFLGIYFRYSIYDMFGNSKDQVDAEVSFSVKNIKNSSTDYVKIGDEVYFKDGGNTFGTIMASTENSTRPLDAQPASETVYISGENKEENKFEIIHYPVGTRVDANGRIKCKGFFSQEGSFMLNGSDYIAPGQTFTVCTEKLTLEITILDISKIN